MIELCYFYFQKIGTIPVRLFGSPFFLFGLYFLFTSFLDYFFILLLIILALLLIAGGAMTYFRAIHSYANIYQHYYFHMLK
jgi:hypothetical protein